ncbi:MAG: phosphotransferase [Bacteroidota bacterium]
MKEHIQHIFQTDLSEVVRSLHEIVGLGSVNKIFSVKGKVGEYIVRLNGSDKRLEYKKEAWCISKVGALGIPGPEVLGTGMLDDICYMIQRKLPGTNGKLCDEVERAIIWEKLGEYCAQYQQIQEIDEAEVKSAAFHKDWKSRLHYNLEELNESDSLLTEKILTKKEHDWAREILKTLDRKAFRMGLVHGDLCPRNVLKDGDEVYLLDWGTAGVNIVPHHEIGLVKMSNEATEEEFGLFLSGLGVSLDAYRKIEEEIRILHFLHQVDVYRWAEGRGLIKVNDYDLKVRKAFNQIK